MTKARELPEYEGLYQITDTGEVYAIRRKGSKGGLRKTYVDPNGYKRVTLTKDYKQRNYLLHSLVAAAWLGPRPKDHDVCHKDGNKLNNNPDNLYYGTRSENSKDAVRHGTHNFLAENFEGERVKGEDCSWSKVTEDVVRYIRLMKGEKSSRTLAKELSISQGNVSAIWTGKTWSHVT